MQIRQWMLLGVIALLLAGCYRQVQHTPCQVPRNDYCKQDVVEERFIHKYGVAVPEEDWDQRGKHGQVLSTLKSGVVVKKNYESGILEGETTYTFPHSDAVEKIETYARGQLVKEVDQYHSGQPKQRIEYLPSSSCTITNWYENGSIKSVEEYSSLLLAEGEYYTSNTQVESRVQQGSGHRVNRDDYGQLLSLDVFKEGSLTQKETYHPNGTPKEIVSFNRGQLHGQRKTFTPSGEPIVVESWQDGAQHGLVTLFENGEKIAEVPYAHGLREGIERRFREGNEVMEEIEWSGDLKHGASQNFVGANTTTDWYFQGKKVSKLNFDQMNQWQAQG